MTVGYCPASKSHRLWFIQVLAVFLVFPASTEKEPSRTQVYTCGSQERLQLLGKHLILVSNHLQNVYPLSALQCHRSTLYKVSFYFTLDLNYLGLRMKLGCQFSDVAQQMKNGHPHQKNELSLLRKELASFTYSFYQTDYVTYIRDGQDSTSYTFVFGILIYKFLQVILSTGKLGKLVSFIWKSQIHIRLTMVSLHAVVSLSALGISTIIGFLTNSFIIGAHGMDRAIGKNINPRELILSTLGLFNIAFQCTMATNDTVLFLWSDLYFSDNVYAIFSVLLLFTIFSSFWLTFCLCGFYYVMLAPFEQTLFMRLKQGISRIVPWMLTSAVLLSLIISVPVAWNITKTDFSDLIQENVTSNSTTEFRTYFSDLVATNVSNNSLMELSTPLYNSFQVNLTNNSTIDYSVPQMNLQYLLITSIIGCCLPLVLVAVINTLIIKSLCVHANRLGKSSGGMSVQSVEASVSAARTITSLLLLFISFFISETLLIMNIFSVDSPSMSVCLIIVYSYGPVLSVILILGSPKLKSMTLKMFYFSKSTQVNHHCDNREIMTSSVSNISTP